MISRQPETPHARPAPGPGDPFVRPVGGSDAEALGLLARCQSFGGPFGDAVAGSTADGVRPTGAAAVAWVAEADDRIAGFAVGSEVAGGVSHIYQVRVHGQYRGRDLDRHLARAAAERALDGGCLKVVLHNPGRVERACEVMGNLGFVFSRRRDRDGEVCLEFYLDLYAMPAAANGAAAAS